MLPFLISYLLSNLFRALFPFLLISLISTSLALCLPLFSTFTPCFSLSLSASKWSAAHTHTALCICCVLYCSAYQISHNAPMLFLIAFPIFSHCYIYLPIENLTSFDYQNVLNDFIYRMIYQLQLSLFIENTFISFNCSFFRNTWWQWFKIKPCSSVLSIYLCQLFVSLIIAKKMQIIPELFSQGVSLSILHCDEFSDCSVILWA